MNGPQRHAARARAPWRAAGWLGIAVCACLPSEDLSRYSSGARASDAPALSESPATGASDDAEANTNAPGPSDPLGGAGVTLDCGACPAPDLPASSDAGTQSGGAAAGEDDVTTDAGSADAGAPPIDPPTPALSCAADAALGPGDRCFVVVSTTSTWLLARSACQSRGAGWDLASIHDAERNAWLIAQLGTVAEAFVGASDLASEGVWQWVDDGAPFWSGTGTAGSSVAGAFESWSNGGTPEPNGDDGSDCARLRASGWADTECDTPFASICEGPPL